MSLRARPRGEQAEDGASGELNYGIRIARMIHIPRKEAKPHDLAPFRGKQF